MKRILGIICAFVIMLSAPLLVACGKDNKENFSTQGVVSNGGTIVVANNYMYFINGVEDRSTSNKNIATSGIFKVKVDENGNQLEEPVQLVSNIAGFEDGSLYVFGEYLYYSTPNNGRDNKGNITHQLTSFYRVKTDGTKKSQLLYTTKVDNSASTTESGGEDDHDSDKVSTLEYAYYKNGEELYLVVYEDSTLTSVKIGQKSKATVIEEKVNQVVFSQNSGEGSTIDSYIFYSKTPLETDSVQTGHKIFRVLPNGEDNILISSSKDVSLLQSKNGHLYFTLDGAIYATPSKDSLSTQKAVSFGTFTYFIMLNDGGVAGVVGEKTYYFNWSSGNLVSYQIYEKAVKFVTEHNGMLYFVYNTYLYRTNAYVQGSAAVKVSTAIVSENLGNYLNIEIYGNKVFFMTKEILTDASGKTRNIHHLSYVLLDNIADGGNTAKRFGK